MIVKPGEVVIREHETEIRFFHHAEVKDPKGLGLFNAAQIEALKWAKKRIEATLKKPVFLGATRCKTVSVEESND